MKIAFWIDGQEFKLNFTQNESNEFLVTLGEKKHRVLFEMLSTKEVLLNIDGRIHTAIVNSNLTSHQVSVDGRSFKLEKKSVLQSLGESVSVQQKKDVKTSMPGKIIKVVVKEGESVEEGQAVLILEAMKMQNEIKSPQTGRITRLVPEPGDSVEAGALLFSVE